MELLQAKDVAEMTKISKAIIYNLAKNGTIPCIKIPGPGGKDMIRFKKEDVVLFLEEFYTKN